MYRPKPWAYLYDVVAYILNRLDKHNQILHRSFILTREIQIKIGRDHGDTYFKTAYQVGNIRNPNRKENTVIFSTCEGKDTSYKSYHLNKINKIKFLICRQLSLVFEHSRRN